MAFAKRPIGENLVTSGQFSGELRENTVKKCVGYSSSTTDLREFCFTKPTLLFSGDAPAGNVMHQDRGP